MSSIKIYFNFVVFYTYKLYKDIVMFLKILLVGLTGLLLTGCQPDEDVMKPAVSKLIADAKTANDGGEQAIAECRLRSALVLLPNNPETLHNLAIVEDEQNKTDAAITHYEKVISLQPDNVDALYGLALDYKKKSQAMVKGTLGAKPTPGDLGDAKLYMEKAGTYAHQFLEKASKNDTGRGQMETLIREADTYSANS